MSLPLSVLDLSPVSSGSTGAQALRNTLELARLADRLGFTRYWLAEHHNIPTIASTAPEVMIAHVAAITERIRVGSGGIMLPNHAPLRIAEEFRVLEALHPGRIDLGIGRAPGTDMLTALALRRSKERLSVNDFPEQLAELIGFGTGRFPEKSPFASIQALPADVNLPPIWILGSSEDGARLAAEMGFPFAQAHHFSPDYTVPAMRLYRHRFKPSVWLKEPKSIVTTSVVCAESDEEAERLAASLELSWVRLRTGHPAPLPSPEEALAYHYSPIEEEIARYARRIRIAGAPIKVRKQIEALAAETLADEVMITSMIYDHAARMRSYELVADVFDLQGYHGG
jgi:luciferase family oxidoreductase group 1